jgi:hypothetical protein
VSPPDSLWISGVCDYVDFDEVLVAAGSAIGHVEDSRLPVGKPTILLVATLPVDAAIAPAVFRSTCSVRAPPA